MYLLHGVDVRMKEENPVEYLVRCLARERYQKGQLIFSSILSAKNFTDFEIHYM